MSDLSLKLRLRRILWAQGYHCPLEVDLSHYEYEENGKALKRSPLTDIDVLGVRFDPDLRLKTVVADCKSGSVSEPTRLFWLRGVMDFFGAEEGLLVKPQLHSHARALAPRLGIRVLDERALEVLEKAVSVEGLGVNVGDLVTYEHSRDLWGVKPREEQKPTRAELNLKEVYHYLQYLYWMVEEFRNIQIIIDRFSLVTSDLAWNDLKARYLAYVGLQRLVLSILRMASAVAGRDVVDIRRQVRIYLFGGVFALREREGIIAGLNELSARAGLDRGTVTLEPPYFDELVEITNRLITGSAHAVRMLQHLDAVMALHVFGEGGSLEKVLGGLYSTDALVIMKRIATLFQRTTGFDPKVFEALWTL